MIDHMINGLSKMTSSTMEVSPDVLVLQFTIVNACIIGPAGAKDGEWILVDTGLESSYQFILQSAKERFGDNSRPAAIILTHGHFDHVGSVIQLAEHWDVAVYVHELEMPYVTGKKDYPQGDPTVDEGLVAKMSPSFPHKAINLGFRAAALPADGKVTGASDWKWVHTPGHTEGHVSLFRERDRMLMAGDAFTTTKQESLSSVMTQREQVKGPPAYLTTDWKAAERSVKLLEDMKPSTVIPSHGLPMQGQELSRHLMMLTNHFKEIAVPNQGRWV